MPAISDKMVRVRAWQRARLRRDVGYLLDFFRDQSLAAISLADVVVVDVQCDYQKETLGNVRQGTAEIAALEDCLRVIGEKIQPECLVLIETTVPIIPPMVMTRSFFLTEASIAWVSFCFLFCGLMMRK